MLLVQEVSELQLVVIGENNLDDGLSLFYFLS